MSLKILEIPSDEVFSHLLGDSKDTKDVGDLLQDPPKVEDADESEEPNVADDSLFEDDDFTLDETFNDAPPSKTKPHEEKEIVQEQGSEESEENNDEDVQEGRQEELQVKEQKILNKALSKILGKKGITVLEDEEGNKHKIEEFPLDEETFETIVDQYFTDLEEKYSKDAIKLKDVSSFTKELIEFEKNGGNAYEFLAYKSDVEKPLNEMDIDSVRDQKRLVRAYFKDLDPDSTEEDIALTISSYEKSGQLKKAAERSQNKLLKKYKTQFEENQRKFQQEYEEFTSKVDLALQEKFNLKGKVKKEILKAATGIDKDTNQFIANKIYTELRKDPEKSAEFTFAMVDPEGYRAYLTSKEVNEAKKKSFKLMSTNKNLKNTKTETSDDTYDRDDAVFKFFKEL